MRAPPRSMDGQKSKITPTEASYGFLEANLIERDTPR